MTDKHQIENKLRVLKLSGILETLEIRLDQAQMFLASEKGPTFGSPNGDHSG